MKTYNHITEPSTAERVRDGIYRILTRGQLGSGAYDVPSFMVENSSDREVVVEKDWISKLYLDIGDYVAINDDIPGERQFRASVEQHMPKDRKFTKQDIRKIADNFTANNEYRFQVIQDFLKHNNLLSYTVE